MAGIAFFPAAASADLISTPIVGTASSRYPADPSYPNPAALVELLTDGSGLTPDSNGNSIPEHDNDFTNMWYTAAHTDPSDAWLEFDFGQVYLLEKVWIWNHNRAAVTWDWFKRGVQDCWILYTTEANPTPGDWMHVGQMHTIPMATGLDGYDAVYEVPFEGIEARKIRIEVENNWFGHTTWQNYLSYVGLSEVQFFAVPEPATLCVLSVGIAGLLVRRRR